MSPDRPAPGDTVVVPVAVVPARAAPTHRSERVSEWLLGETVTVERVEEGWMQASGTDGYRGWTPAGPFRVPATATGAWERSATLRSLGTAVAEGPLRRLPWGSRLAPGPEGSVLLPDGALVRVVDPGRIVRAPRAAATDAAAVVRSAREWLGVPYGWGGRTELGVDCSGFVQAVYAVHGVTLPRDSREQSERFPSIDPEGFEIDALVPGDLVFFAPEGRGVTHVGLCAGGTRILHAASSRGCVCEDDLADGDGLCRRLRDSRVVRSRPLTGESDLA